MTTSTSTAAPVKVYERTAQEERAHNIQINGDKPLIEVKGTNTYPIANLLRVFGGKWNKETKTWSVPDHKWHEAQTAADEQTKKQADRDAAKANKPAAPVKAPEVKAAPVKAVATPVTTAPVAVPATVPANARRTCDSTPSKEPPPIWVATRRSSPGNPRPAPS